MKPSDLETLEATVSLQRLAESKGLKLRKSGNTFTGTCPFHVSKKPTLTIDPKLNTWTCSGKCKVRNGSVVQWIMKAEGVSRKHAVELLRSDFGTETVKPPKGKKSTVNKLDSFVGTEDPDHVVMDRIVSYYSATLKQSLEGQGYLRDRKLIHGELIDHFRLGYSNRTLGYRLQPRNRKHGFQLRSQLERLGIYRKSGHELMWGCLTIPIQDENGIVVDLYGRKILGDKRLRPGTPLHMWLPGSRKSIFNIQAMKASQEIVVTGGLINALTFWTMDLRNVTAAHGIEHFKECLLPALQSHGTKRVYLAFRRTKEGEQMATAVSDSLSAQGIETFKVVFPQGMDANDLTRNTQSPRDALSQAVRSAVWMKGKKAVQVPEAQGEPVQPVEPSPIETVESEQPHGDEVVLHLGDRRWRIRGLRKNLSFEAMKVNLLVNRENGHPMGHGFHVDTLELYSARQRTAFIRQAADELGLDEQIVKHDLGKVLLELERLQDQLIRETLEPENKPVEMTEAEREQALQLLRDRRIVERIVSDLEKCGLIGESTNKLVAYLAVTSRKLSEPLAVLIQSSSAAGKTSLMDSVLAFVPEEDRQSFSAMTGQSLFYMPSTGLAHKVLSVAEETGAHRASYALKLLQSEGEISIASTAKDPGTGRLVTQEYRVNGPVMLFMTTTSLDLDPELANRCIVLTVDEGREQTQAIHALQRQKQTLAGLLQGQDRDALVTLHRNVQRLLRPVHVVNPYALELSYFDGQTRSRRDHAKYLTLIRTVTLLHQYQRTVKTVEHQGRRVEFIEVTQADLELANRLAKEVLNPAAEEIPPQTAKLLDMIRQCVQEIASAQEVEPSKVRFTRRQLREHVGLSNSTLRLHLARLVDLEYLIQERGQRRVTFYSYDADLAGLEATWRGHGGPPPRQVEGNDSRDLSSLGGNSQPARLRKQPKSASYSHVRGR